MSVEMVKSPADTASGCFQQSILELELTEPHCPRHWDHLLCWPQTPSNRTVAIPCQASKAFVKIVLSSRPTIERHLIPGLAYQECNSTGFWADKTDYEECTTFLNEILSEEETRRKVRHAVSVITFALCLTSMILLLVALGIFSFFKSLECDRLKVHKNFMLALVIRYVVSVIYYEPYIYGNPSPDVWFRDVGKGYLCKLVLVLMMYGYVAPVFWMFVEGLYLHTLIATNVFDPQSPFKFYYFIGWFLPLVCVVSWATTMATQSPDLYCDDTDTSCKGNHTCWEGYDEQPFAYILSVPMTIALALNLLFLVNIVRILVTKLQVPSSTTHANARKTLRATFILFPLLGITNLLFFINPKNGTHDKIYMLFNATMQSSQGIFLAILYCFLNAEVQEAIKRHFQRAVTRNDIYRATDVGGESAHFRATLLRRRDDHHNNDGPSQLLSHNDGPSHSQIHVPLSNNHNRLSPVCKKNSEPPSVSSPGIAKDNNIVQCAAELNIPTVTHNVA